jgi:hypothetical protein
MDLKTNYCQLVELVVAGVSGGNNQLRIQFTDQPYLRFAHILKLETYDVNDLATSPTNNPVITAATLKAAYITLYTGDADNPSNQGEWIQNLPLQNLHYIQNSSNDPFERRPFLLDSQTIIWEKSYITLGTAIGNTDPISFLFNVTFVPKDTQ